MTHQHVQSRADSLIEALLNTLIGWTITIVTYCASNWYLGLALSWWDIFNLTGIFTVVSILRQYFLRRLLDGRSPWTALKILLRRHIRALE